VGGLGCYSVSDRRKREKRSAVAISIWYILQTCSTSYVIFAQSFGQQKVGASEANLMYVTSIGSVEITKHRKPSDLLLCVTSAILCNPSSQQLSLTSFWEKLWMLPDF
jgi:hypothetical protein